MELLKKHNACEKAKEWAQGKTIEEAFTTCPRGDWMLWLFAKTNPDDLQRLTLAKGHCANTVRNMMKDERSIKAVDVAIAFGEGNATKEELNAAAGAAYAAAGAAYAGAAYAAAADAAAYAAAGAAAAADAAGVDAAAAAAAGDAADDAAYAAAGAAAAADAAGVDAAGVDAAAAGVDAKKSNQLQTADICRKYLPLEIWNIK